VPNPRRLRRGEACVGDQAWRRRPRVVRAAGRRFPDRVRVLDWVRHSAGRRGWFAGDGIHLGSSGAAGLARLMRRALPFATAPLCP